MQKINKFKDVSLNNELQMIHGGYMGAIPTKGEGYTDQHNDNDNDGTWSEGDTFVIVWE